MIICPLLPIVQDIGFIPLEQPCCPCNGPKAGAVGDHQPVHSEVSPPVAALAAVGEAPGGVLRTLLGASVL